MALHSTLTGADLHEPKGVAAAPAGRVYLSDGLGSGTWVNQPALSVAVADPNGVFTGTDLETVLYELYQIENLIEGSFADISTGETILLPVPYSCTVEEITMILGGSITVANSTVTVTRSDGAAMGSQVILQSGSAEGTAFTFVPSGNGSFTFPTHRYIKLVTDGASTTAARLYVQARIKRV